MAVVFAPNILKNASSSLAAFTNSKYMLANDIFSLLINEYDEIFGDIENKHKLETNAEELDNLLFAKSFLKKRTPRTPHRNRGNSSPVGTINIKYCDDLYLQIKKNKKIFWEKRYFILNNSVLRYSKKKQLKGKAKEVKLTSNSKVSKSNLDKPFSFCIVVNDKLTLYLAATTKEQQNIWLGYFNNVIAAAN